ncbi:MAG: ATP-dependent helicase [Verrucomicrobia bacterium]|nr:ATP-dependent helicase [Verrucomicrobiota bacterium]
MDYARELNPQQYAAVTADPGPALVIAGAGAGKTRTLTYRVAYLLEQGVPPENILLLTFTNKAAGEMMRRVAQLVARNLAGLWGGTFHAVGNRVLRRHAERLGYRPDFTILDREDAEDLLGVCLAESQIDVKATRFPKPEVLADLYSFAANTCQPIPQVLERRFPHVAHLRPQLESLHTSYSERKRIDGVMDFDDLLCLWLQLLTQAPDVCEHYQRRFQFLLVDEYQDTNRLQSDLIDRLAARHHNVMAVGDDSQSIYAWRGANFRNILRFPERHPGARVFKIETNYRSTPEILRLANAAIAPNIHQHRKELVPVRGSGQKPALAVCDDGGFRAAFVTQRVLELQEGGMNLRNMAVLYRSHFHALELQLELSRRNISFAITSGIRFFEQAHIKDVAAYLRFVCNPQDELAFKRLVRLLPGIGAKAADKLWREWVGQLATVRRASASRAVAFQALSRAVPKKSQVSWAELATTLAQLDTPETRNCPSEMIRLVLEAGYQEYLQQHFANYRARLDDLEQLAAYAAPFEKTDEFLSQLALLTNVEAEAETAGKTNAEDRLRLSTIHQAKGLEFDVVFVIMLCEGLFPSQRALDNEEGEEEERRLFYVALTRARNELYLCYPLERASYRAGPDLFQQPSRFLAQLPCELVEEWNLRSYSPPAH